MWTKSIVLLVGLMWALAAQAVCYRDGKAHPTGTNINGFVCQPDGTWKRS